MEKLANIRTIETKHFTFQLDALVEHESPTSIFGDMPNIVEEEKAIEEGRAVYFCARARLVDRRYGLILGTDYLGACCYESYESFSRDAYAVDMAGVVVDQARDAVSDLAAGASPDDWDQELDFVSLDGAAEHFNQIRVR